MVRLIPVARVLRATRFCVLLLLSTFLHARTEASPGDWHWLIRVWYAFCSDSSWMTSSEEEMRWLSTFFLESIRLVHDRWLSELEKGSGCGKRFSKARNVCCSRTSHHELSAIRDTLDESSNSSWRSRSWSSRANQKESSAALETCICSSILCETNDFISWPWWKRRVSLARALFYSTSCSLNNPPSVD